MNGLWKYLNKAWIIFFLVAMIYFLVFEGATRSFPQKLVILSTILIVLVPSIIKKIFHYSMSETLKFFYFLFVFVALTCGSVIGLYWSTSWFDLVAHFLSGILSSLVGLIFLKQYQILKKISFSFHLIFLIAFVMTIASLWEFFEFFANLIWKADPQLVRATGVNDTMLDMMMALLGGIAFAIYYFMNMKKDQSKFMKRIEQII